MNRFSAAFLLATVLAPGARAQDAQDARAPGQARYDSATVAWDEGRYPDALAGLERLLTSPDADRFREPAALLTGELYRTTEIASDGARLRWSADGRFASYASDAGRTLHVVAVEGGAARPVARFAGAALAFAPDGRRAAYLVIDETAGLRAARARADSLLRAAAGGAYGQQLQTVARLEQEASRVVVRSLPSGPERTVALGSRLAPRALAFTADGAGLVVVAAPPGEPGRSNLYLVPLAGGAARALTEGPGAKGNVLIAAGGRHLVYSAGPSTVVVLDLATGALRDFAGETPALSADGSTLAFARRSLTENSVSVVALGDTAGAVVVKLTDRPLATPALSPDGGRVAFAMMPREDWEVYVVGRDGTGETRLTREIQHDRSPRWLSDGRVLAMKGEPRHTRAVVYDAAGGAARRLHHNNTVRTVAPEYEWAPSPDGTRVLIVADRDGDTISPERGVYLADLTATVSTNDVLARVRASAAAEADLRARGRTTFAPVDAAVRAATAGVSVERIYGYERALFGFDSKHITKPGNALAIAYLADQVRAMGYEPEMQWFEPRPGVRTANVVATLRGTTDPDLVYVISSHFDSVADGPGADDNTSGTAALLEAARVLAHRPQAATIRFAWFTGEEAGLLGSREFVRRAVAAGDKLVGALNNDMVGWANDARLDNTIRYSNDGIRDVQHAAAFLYSSMVTYDARYYKSTDAHAYYEVYGDIVGGIGSYPILGNPHYHQAHDVLETINHRLVAEVSKTTVASIMLLASSPSRPAGLALAGRPGGGIDVSWTPAAEAGVRAYAVTYGPAADPHRHALTVTTPRATLPDAGEGTVVSVRAVGAGGVPSWDAARATVGGR